MKIMRALALTGIIFFQTITSIGTLPAAAAENKMFELVGFAAMEGGTTGGAGGRETTVKTLADLKSALSQKKNDTAPLTIKIEGKISGSEAVGVKDLKNLSIIGAASGGELEGVGLNIVRSSNIIVRNLKIHHTLAPTDCIGIEKSDHIWVDHCELYNMIGDCNGDGKIDTKGDIEGGDIDWYDGLLDCKNDSSYITVSWNYFHDSFKTSLVGSSDSDNYDRRMTYHHNLFKNCKERLPSYRFGTGHVFNNYYADIWHSAVNSRMGAKLRVEANCFENVGSGAVNGDTGLAAGPIGAYNGEPGFYDVKDNIFTNCRGNQPTVSTCSYTPPYQYSSVLTPASQVKELVTKYAGVGKLEGDNPDTPTLYGDANGDGSVDSIDMALLKQYLLGQTVNINNGALDLDRDASITSLDLAVLKKYLLGQVKTLPV